MASCVSCAGHVYGQSRKIKVHLPSLRSTQVLVSLVAVSASVDVSRLKALCFSGLWMLANCFYGRSRVAKPARSCWQAGGGRVGQAQSVGAFGAFRSRRCTPWPDAKFSPETRSARFFYEDRESGSIGTCRVGWSRWRLNIGSTFGFRELWEVWRTWCNGSWRFLCFALLSPLASCICVRFSSRCLAVLLASYVPVST